MHYLTMKFEYTWKTSFIVGTVLFVEDQSWDEIFARVHFNLRKIQK